eukprot:4942484-Amphidinium_carterae.2
MQSKDLVTHADMCKAQEFDGGKSDGAGLGDSAPLPQDKGAPNKRAKHWNIVSQNTTTGTSLKLGRLNNNCWMRGAYRSITGKALSWKSVDIK